MKSDILAYEKLPCEDGPYGSKNVEVFYGFLQRQRDMWFVTLKLFIEMLLDVKLRLIKWRGFYG